MKSKDSQKYLAFLRGINVGGHHKVPMKELAKEMTSIGFTNVVTLLNSGNIIFESGNQKISELEALIASKLEHKFGFEIPTIVVSADTIEQLSKADPFQNVVGAKEIRFYVSLLKHNTNPELTLPWKDEGLAFTILEVRDRMVFSVLDVAVSKTPKAMKVLEQFFGKGITTRSWKTIERVMKKLDL